MNKALATLAVFATLNLLACSSQPSKDTPAVTAAPEASTATAPAAPQQPPVIANEKYMQEGQNPPMSIKQGKKTLGLVRIMDGGVCKNPQQGTRGSFLIYADLDDIKHIKKQKGEKIFAEFETKIQEFSAEALQEAVDQTNLGQDPFVLDNQEAQDKLAKQLDSQFQKAVAGALKQFKKDHHLTVDVVAFQPSFIFFQSGCDTAFIEQENPEDAAPVK
ncbi:hypothetical protein JCM14076_28030 [Methylosoma difficile]